MGLIQPTPNGWRRRVLWQGFKGNGGHGSPPRVNALSRSTEFWVGGRKPEGKRPRVDQML